MQLCVVRHGQASFQAPNDVERELTATGREDIKALAAHLRHLAFAPEKILVSPYIRTLQTCRILMTENAWQCEVEPSALLTPEASPEQLLQALPECSSVLLVSHQPLVSLFIALAVDGSTHNNDALNYAMSPGAMRMLTLDLPSAGLATLSSSYGY